MVYLKAFGMFALLALVAPLAVVAIVVFGIYFILAFCAMIGVMFLCWAFGVPIAIKQNGTKIGYYRWFTFYPDRR